MYFLQNDCSSNSGWLSVEGSHWHLGAKPALQKINPLINLPYVEIHDADQKIVVAQSIACMTLLPVS